LFDDHVFDAILVASGPTQITSAGAESAGTRSSKNESDSRQVPQSPGSTAKHNETEISECNETILDYVWCPM
jgi:hypothetical protein